jgi:hypothetical protein
MIELLATVMIALGWSADGGIEDVELSLPDAVRRQRQTLASMT